MNTNAIKIIIGKVIVKYAHDINILDLHDLNRFYSLIGLEDLDGIEYPDFVMYKRKIFLHEKLTSSSIHLLHLD